MLRTFAKGGVHPPENKLSAKKKIEQLNLPELVQIPIAQHIGAPATVLVKRNDNVKVGQIIAQSSGFVSANIHSSVSGTVAKIEEIIDRSGYRRKVVTIKVEGDEWLEEIDQTTTLKNNITASAAEIVKKVADSGIVGLGGATFPSHIKLSVPKGSTAEFLIINGVECEPYLTSDHRLMLEKADEMLIGIKIIMKALDVKKAIIGIENNKKDAIELLQEKCSQHQGIEVCPLYVKYPQGGEKQLIKATINREVPSGGLPIAVGAVVHNVGTAVAIYEAVQKNKPLFERIVTITGKSIKNPANYKVRIGTPITQLLEKGGCNTEQPDIKIIDGGPMMGKSLNNLDAPVTKGTSGILVVSEKESKRKPVKNCIRCAKCVTACPMGLEPFLLMTLGERSMHDELEKENIMDCMECGSCSFTCPSNRPLLDYIRLGKGAVGKILRERKK